MERFAGYSKEDLSKAGAAPQVPEPMNPPGAEQGTGTGLFLPPRVQDALEEAPEEVLGDVADKIQNDKKWYERVKDFVEGRLREGSLRRICACARQVPQEHQGAFPMGSPLMQVPDYGEEKPELLVGEAVDVLPGGIADNQPSDRFDSQQLAEGIEVEREHTDNLQVQKEIAEDHLMELPDYYSRLKKMEQEAKGGSAG